MVCSYASHTLKREVAIIHFKVTSSCTLLRSTIIVIPYLVIVPITLTELGEYNLQGVGEWGVSSVITYPGRGG